MLLDGPVTGGGGGCDLFWDFTQLFLLYYPNMDDFIEQTRFGKLLFITENRVTVEFSGLIDALDIFSHKERADLQITQ